MPDVNPLFTTKKKPFGAALDAAHATAHDMAHDAAHATAHDLTNGLQSVGVCGYTMRHDQETLDKALA
jgi:hypothetical protein